jgi:PPOX class probable F420-dependent enzyme
VQDSSCRGPGEEAEKSGEGSEEDIEGHVATVHGSRGRHQACAGADGTFAHKSFGAAAPSRTTLRIVDTDLERLAGESYVLLTTFRKIGEPVRTPVWVARLDGELGVWTERGSGKVKRLRRDARVELAACDIRGRPKGGASVTGRARVLDEEGSARVREAITGKYGLLGRVTLLVSRLRGGTDRTVGLAVGSDGSE